MYFLNSKCWFLGIYSGWIEMILKQQKYKKKCFQYKKYIKKIKNFALNQALKFVLNLQNLCKAQNRRF